MRSVALHLDAGSDVRRSLEQLAREQNASGFVLSVVGNLSQAAFQCPGSGQPTVLSGLLEIITLQGTIGPEGVHLHLSLSDGHCQVWGGHLEPGTLVLNGADLLVAFTDPAGEPAATSGQSPAAVAAPAGQPRLTIAVKAGCPWCKRALRLLRTLGIPYQLVEPKAGGTVPQIAIDGVAIGGYDALVELHGRGDLEALRQA
jgi:predicted DNA-binding protein with PD1-like motif/glutaredoxin